jgi:hypothetical protein
MLPSPSLGLTSCRRRAARVIHFSTALWKLASNSFPQRPIEWKQERVWTNLAGSVSRQATVNLTSTVLRLWIGVGMWYSKNLCEDARPFAPYMSYGSRATQAKPDALPSCSEKTPETALFFAGDRRFVSAGTRGFPNGNLFLRASGWATHRCAYRCYIRFAQRMTREKRSLRTNY